METDKNRLTRRAAIGAAAGGLTGAAIALRALRAEYRLEPRPARRAVADAPKGSTGSAGSAAGGTARGGVCVVTTRASYTVNGGAPIELPVTTRRFAYRMEPTSVPTVHLRAGA
jgi:hypothetical protein